MTSRAMGLFTADDQTLFGVVCYVGAEGKMAPACPSIGTLNLDALASGSFYWMEDMVHAGVKQPVS